MYMNRPAKILLWLLAAIAALFAIAAIAFLFLFDPNNFKDDVERAAEESTGRELHIDGDVSVQIFPWLAVEIGEVRLGNAPGFGDEPFAAIDSVTLSVQLMPLVFQRQVVVGTAEIDGLQLNLAVRADGTDNWSDLAEGRDSEAVIDEEEGRGSGQTSGKLAVSGVAVRNATITYASGADRYSLSEGEFTIGPVYGDKETLVVGDIALRALLSGATEIPTRLKFETGGIDVDVQGQVASVRPIEMSVLGIDLSATFEPINYAGELDAKAALRVDTFSPRSVMTQLGIEPPATADPNALSKVSIDGTAAIGTSSARLSGVTVKVDDTTLTGAMTVPFDPAGRFVLKLAGDSIDLNRYMTVDGEATGTGEAAPPMEVPADLIKPLNARGDLEFGSVRVGNLELTGVTVGLDAADGRMRIHPIAAGLFGGSYSGDVRIDVSGKTPSLSMNESVQGVDLAKLAMAMFEQKNITGTIAGNFKLGGRGNDLGQIRETLGGTMSLELKDGTYEGTDIWYELRRARALLKQEEPPQPELPARTPFSSVTASGVVTNGVMRNEDLKAEMPFMELTGAGDVDLGKGTVDYGLRARIFSKPELMGDATPEEISDLTKAVIPLRISGSLASPKVAPDVDALVRGRVEEELKEKEEEVKEKLEEKLKDIFKR
jgi:AsmA protein